MSQIATPSLAPAAPAPAAPAAPAPGATPPVTPPAPAPVASNATPPATPPAAPAAPAAPAPTPAVEPTTPSLKPAAAPEGELNIKSVFEKAGLDARVIAKEFVENGTVSDETVRLIKASDPKLNFMGKELIRDFVAGQAAMHQIATMRAETAIKAATEAVGGATQLENLKTWAAQNVDPARMAKLEAMIKNDATLYPDVVRILANEYASKAGAAGSKPLIGGQPGTAGLAGAKPTNPQEMASLMGRVNSGDRTAAQILSSMSMEEIARIQ